MNTLHKTTLVLAIAVAAIPAAHAAQSRAAGTPPQASANAAASTHRSGGGARALEGVWDVRITIKDCITGDTIFQGRGQSMAIRGGAFVATTGAAMTDQGPGLGQWRYDPPGRHFVTRHRHFTFDPATGAPTGFQIVEREVELSEDGNSSIGEDVFEFQDMTGAVVSSGCASDVATRILEN